MKLSCFQTRNKIVIIFELRFQCYCYYYCVGILLNVTSVLWWIDCYKRCCYNRFFSFLCLSIYSFGKRSGVSIRRPNECLILEPSEMLVVSKSLHYYYYYYYYPAALLACLVPRHVFLFTSFCLPFYALPRTSEIEYHALHPSDLLDANRRPPALSFSLPPPPPPPPLTYFALVLFSLPLFCSSTVWSVFKELDVIHFELRVGVEEMDGWMLGREI